MYRELSKSLRKNNLKRSWECTESFREVYERIICNQLWERKDAFVEVYETIISD